MSQSIASYIDHAVLHPTQTEDDLRAACQLCAELGVASICVKPYAVALAAELLAGSDVKVSTVIGFPHGANATEAKVAEVCEAIRAGAVELDMVVNLGLVFSGRWDDVEQDILAVVECGKGVRYQLCEAPGGPFRQLVPDPFSTRAIVKVIFETGLLASDDQKRRLCACSERAGAAFVKTSTGFGFVKQADGTMKSTGATEHDVTLMRETCSSHVGVKASGGIRSLADARRFVELGATRLGTSSTQALVDEERGAGVEARTASDY